MKLQVVLFLLLAFSTAALFSQSSSTSDDILLTVDGDPVSKKEFYRVYNKNLEMVQDENQKDINSYLELFIDYKLKIKEAYDQGLHKNPQYIKEFTMYEEQLAHNYLYDQKITDDLIEEAYNRLQEEVHANHILIMVAANAKPHDTLTAYNKIKDIRQQALKGADFIALAKKYSEEPKAEETAGDLGFFKGFAMVYPFENAAYETPVGEVSDIIRTQFGYHILKVNNRRLVPQEVTVAHIMIANKKDVIEEDVKKRITELRQKVMQGEDFAALAKQFSDDQGSATNGGVMTRFGSGRLNAPDFENAAFNLAGPGDISQPVRTDFGWHIIKLIERHPYKKLDESREDLFKRIKNSDRAKVIVESVNQMIKNKYGFTKDVNAMNFFELFVTNSILSRKWEYNKDDVRLDKTLFSIADKIYTYGDFAAYLAEKQKKAKGFKDISMLLNDNYKEFEDEKLKDYFKLSLAKENEDYAAILSEYRDGLLIYDLMQNNIWEPARKDSIGLEKFYNDHKENYKWKKRIAGDILSGADKKTAKKARKLLLSGKSAAEIKTLLNTADQINIIITSGTFETDHRALPEKFNPKNGISKVYKHTIDSGNNPAQFIVVDVKEVLPEQIKPFVEIKGKVMSDYQNHLEETWMKQLRAKYVVKVNKNLLDN